MPLASLTSAVTSLLTHHGALAVFLILAIDAVLPVGGELPMLVSGAIAAGAIGHGTSALGLHVPDGLATYLVLAGAGTLGYLAGSIGGWAIGRRGGRTLVERHGRWVHLDARRMDRAERWFDRHGGRAVLLGRVTPLVRSFISVAAGVLEAPFAAYVLLTLVGGAAWCFALAGVGWALGSQWESVHHAFRFVEVAVVAGLAALALAAAQRVRASRAAP